MTAIDQTEVRRREAREWITRLTSGQATTADALAAKLWCDQSPGHARAFAEATLLWETMEPVARQVANRALEATRHKSQTGMRRRAFLGGAIGAGVAAVAGALIVRPPLELWPSLSDLVADYRTGTGERRKLAINDISIEMNTRSSLNVLPATGEVRRLELVAGEAIFTTGGNPAGTFVLAGGGQVSATESKFDVRCDGNAASVICLQGTVKVDYRGRDTTLQKGQRIDYGTSGLGAALAVDPTEATAWREGRLVFHNAPLSRVVDEVNRYRQGRIVLMNEVLGRRSVEVTLPIDRTDELLVLLRQAYGVKVTNLPGGIVILT